MPIWWNFLICMVFPIYPIFATMFCLFTPRKLFTLLRGWLPAEVDSKTAAMTALPVIAWNMKKRSGRCGQEKTITPILLIWMKESRKKVMSKTKASKKKTSAVKSAPKKSTLKKVMESKEVRDVLTITKKQLVEKISLDTKQTKVRTKETVQLFLDTITNELKNGNRIELRDFGVFEVKERAARVGRNPRTGDTVKVPARKVVSFKVGRKMKQYVADSKNSK